MAKVILRRLKEGVLAGEEWGGGGGGGSGSSGVHGVTSRPHGWPSISRNHSSDYSLNELVNFLRIQSWLPRREEPRT